MSRVSGRIRKTAKICVCSSSSSKSVQLQEHSYSKISASECDSSNKSKFDNQKSSSSKDDSEKSSNNESNSEDDDDDSNRRSSKDDKEKSSSSKDGNSNKSRTSSNCEVNNNNKSSNGEVGNDNKSSNSTSDNENGLKWWDLKNNYICTGCNQKFKSMARLESHLIAHRENNFECYKPRWIANRHHLKANLPQHDDRKTLNEDERMDVDDDITNKWHWTQLKNNFICMGCNVKCNSILLLKAHLPVHNKQNNKFIDFAKNVKDNLSYFASENYVARECDNKLKKKMKCEECNKLFADKRKWRLHLIVHMGKKQFKCEDCGKCFKMMKKFKLHLIVHAIDNKYQCQECEKWFGSKKKWKFHSMVHKVDEVVKDLDEEIF